MAILVSIAAVAVAVGTITQCAYADLVYAPTAAGTYLPLNGATVKGPMNVILKDCPTGSWTFSLDGKAVNTESACPISFIEDNALFDTTALADGPHTLSVAGPTTMSAKFTVANKPPPAPVAQATVTLGTWGVSGISSITGLKSLDDCVKALVARAIAGKYGCVTSNTVTIKLVTPVPPVIPPVTPPIVPVPPPSPVIVSSAGAATLSWSAPLENTDGSPALVKGYTIYYGQAPNTAAQIVPIAVQATQYRITGLTAGLWYFSIAAANAVGEGNRSGMATIVVK